MSACCDHVSIYTNQSVRYQGPTFDAIDGGGCLGPSNHPTIPEVVHACIVFLVRCTFTCVPPPQ